LYSFNLFSSQFFKDICSKLENDFKRYLESEVSDEYGEDAIRPLPWYPGNLAWHLNFSRKQLRKNQALESFHEFLKHESEVGNITRQEAVSMVPPLFLNIQPDHHVLDSMLL
jgi:multisite-specific tRNA:(cytosine-C5)-methyltransferase